MPRRYRRLVALVLQLCALLLAFPALAAPTHIKPELLVEGPAAPGGTVTLAFLMKPDKGWHGYWVNPGDAGLGLSPTWSLPPGAKVGELAYPVPQTLIVAGLMNHVYKREYALLVPFTVPADAKPGQVLDLRAKAQWLACTDEICVPEAGELATTVTVGQQGQYLGLACRHPGRGPRQGRLAQEQLHQLPHAVRGGRLLRARPDQDRAASLRGPPCRGHPATR